MSEGQLKEPPPSDLTLSEDDRRELIAWATICVRRLLPVFEQHRPEDPRLMQALDATALFLRGELTVSRMRRYAFTCHAVARECTNPAATAVARAFGQTVAIAHMARHARNLARYTQKVLTGHELTEELQRQQAELPKRFQHYIYGD